MLLTSMSGQANISQKLSGSIYLSALKVFFTEGCCALLMLLQKSLQTVRDTFTFYRQTNRELHRAVQPSEALH